MAAAILAKGPLAGLKKSLLTDFADIKSAHLSEALAHSLGFRTHAALLSAMTGPEDTRPFVLLDSVRFMSRLAHFGYVEDPEFDFESMLFEPIAGVVSTMPDSAYAIEYSTLQDKAWRNLMVCAINAALEQNLFSLRPGDNRFPKEDPPYVYDFTLPNGRAARGSVSDAGFNELSIHAAVNPNGAQLRAANAGLHAGDAFGTTWLERERGAWMQTSTDSFCCRKSILQELANLEVSPLGYGDRGHIIM